MTRRIYTPNRVPWRVWAGPVLLLAIGETLIVLRHRPASDFYFPFAWLGYILLLERTLRSQQGASLWTARRAVFLALFPISAVFWWIFELFNLAVHNWAYVGAERYQGAVFVVYASVDFSLVLLAVLLSAQFMHALLPRGTTARDQCRSLPRYVAPLCLAAGVLCIALPIAFPRYAFGLIWCSLFFLLDPINYRLERPSILRAVELRNWRLPLSLALGALMCGLFWEAWNFWAMPKWRYSIPYVGFWHIFEMPVLGWLGYLPFGLELFAMANFVLPLLGLGTLEIGGEAATVAGADPERISA